MIVTRTRAMLFTKKGWLYSILGLVMNQFNGDSNNTSYCESWWITDLTFKKSKDKFVLSFLIGESSHYFHFKTNKWPFYLKNDIILWKVSLLSSRISSQTYKYVKYEFFPRYWSEESNSRFIHSSHHNTFYLHQSGLIYEAHKS